MLIRYIINRINNWLVIFYMKNISLGCVVRLRTRFFNAYQRILVRYFLGARLGASSDVIIHYKSLIFHFQPLNIGLSLLMFNPLTTQCRILTHLRYIAVENIVRKGEIACKKQFFLFSQCFLFLYGT